MKPQSWSLLDLLSKLGLGTGAGPERSGDDGGHVDVPRRNSMVIALGGALPYAAAAFWRVTYTPFPFGNGGDLAEPISDALVIGLVCFAAIYAVHRLIASPGRPRRRRSTGRRPRLGPVLLEAIALVVATALGPISWGLDLGPDVWLAALATAVAGGVIVWLAIGLMVDAAPDDAAPAS